MTEQIHNRLTVVQVEAILDRYVDKEVSAVQAIDMLGLIPVCIQDDTVLYSCHVGAPWRDRFKSVLKMYKEPNSCVIKP